MADSDADMHRRDGNIGFAVIIPEDHHIHTQIIHNQNIKEAPLYRFLDAYSRISR